MIRTTPMPLCPRCGSALRRAGDGLVCGVCNYREALHELVIDDEHREGDVAYSAYFQTQRRRRLAPSRAARRVGFEALVSQTVAEMERRAAALGAAGLISTHALAVARRSACELAGFFAGLTDATYQRRFAQLERAHGVDLLGALAGDGAAVFNPALARNALLHALQLAGAALAPRALLGPRGLLPDARLRPLQLFFGSAAYRADMRALAARYRSPAGWLAAHAAHYRLLRAAEPRAPPAAAVLPLLAARRAHMHPLVAYFPRAALARPAPCAPPYALAANCVAAVALALQAGLARARPAPAEREVAALAAALAPLREVDPAQRYPAAAARYAAEARARFEEHRALLGELCGELDAFDAEEAGEEVEEAWEAGEERPAPAPGGKADDGATTEKVHSGGGGAARPALPNEIAWDDEEVRRLAAEAPRDCGLPPPASLRPPSRMEDYGLFDEVAAFFGAQPRAVLALADEVVLRMRVSAAAAPP